MKAVLLIALFAATLLSCTFLLHGSKEHLLSSGVAGIVCIGLFFVRRSKKEGMRQASHALVYALALLGGVALSYFPGAVYYRAQVSSTKKKLDSVFASLEESRGLSGAYPERIDELLERCQLPWLSRGKVIFHSRADFFWIYFRDVNSGLMDIYIYDSNVKAWSYRQR